jgi:hypothetical protein
MTFSDPPRTAAWQHRDARSGLEVVFLHPDGDGYRVEGHVTAVEAGEGWALEYDIRLDRDWVTRTARVRGHRAAGRREVVLEADGTGRWTVDGEPAPELDGCPDVDLEASAFTNALPVHRLGLEVGQEADAPAAWVRALHLGAERLEQRYARRPDDGERPRFHYAAPELAFETELVYDAAGLVIDYPGIAVRAA